MKPKPFTFWAKWIARIWGLSFAVIIASLVIVLQLLKIKGLSSKQVLDAILQVSEIYLPFLGAIFGAYAYAFKKRRWSDVPVDNNFPWLVLSISALFNFMMLAWTFSFLADLYVNVEDYIADIKIIAAAMAFFIGWFLAYFFQESHGPEGNHENFAEQEPANLPPADKNK
jgi:hypothetical protein